MSTPKTIDSANFCLFNKMEIVQLRIIDHGESKRYRFSLEIGSISLDASNVYDFLTSALNKDDASDEP